MPDDMDPSLETDEVDLEGLPAADIQSTLYSRFAWDCLPCQDVQEFLSRAGKIPSSAEGTEIEHRDSHARLANVAPMDQFFQVYAGVLGTILTRAITDAAGVTEEMGDVIHKFEAQNTEIVYAASRAVVAQLVSVGVLTYAEGVLSGE